MKRKTILLLTLATAVAFACNPAKNGDDDLYGSADRYEANNAAAYYFGTSAVKGADLYGLSLFRGNIDENYYLDGKGMELYLELLCPESESLTLKTGTYKAFLKSSGLVPPFSIATGSISNGSVLGSYVEFVPSEVANPEYYVLTDATVTVGKRGNNYVIDAKVLAGGESFVFTYSGTMDVLDCSAGGGEGDYDTGMDYTFSEFTKGEIDWFGGEKGLYYWGIYLGDAQANLEDLSSPGSMLQIELCTKSSSPTEIPAGTYTVSDTDADMTASAIYEVEEGYAGTMYCLNDFIVVGATSGTVKVSRSGSNYTVEADLYDSEYDNTFKGSYTGPLTYVDYTKAGYRPAKAKTTSKQLAREGKRNFSVRGRV